MFWDFANIGSYVSNHSLVNLYWPQPTTPTRRKKNPGKSRHSGARSPWRTHVVSSQPHDPNPPASSLKERNSLGVLLPLEPRILFDGAALVTGSEVIENQLVQDHSLQEVDTPSNPDATTDALTGNIDLVSALSTVTAPSERREIVFIDTSIQDYETLLAGINPSAEAVLLDSTRDGVEQIAEVLAVRTDIDAIHVIAHGSQGELHLGAGVLNLSSMRAEYADELATINQALTDQADLLIYGCNFGDGEIGQRATTLLAELTGTDVAASVDDTGSAQYGGDWDLEVQTGTIETSIAVDSQAREHWHGVLDLSPVDEFVINDPSSNNETTSGLLRGAEQAVSIGADGNYVVVWTDETANNIFAKVLTDDGNEKVTQFQVNIGGGVNHQANVAMDDAENFVVTWTQDGDVFMRRFLPDGTPIDAGDVRVNLTTTNTQQNSTITINDAGDFVIAWESSGGADEGIFVRQGSLSGGLSGTDITVDSTITAQSPSVGIADSGDFVVVWDDTGDVFFRQYNGAGSLQNNGQVDTLLQTNAGNAAVDMTGDGRFTVAYQATGIGFGVYARQYDTAGNPLALPQLVNASFNGDQANPSISMDDTGAFIVVWEGNGDQPGQVDTSGVFGQTFDSSGTKIDTEFLINQTTTNIQDRASVAMLDSDDFVVVWTGQTSGQTDVYSRQYGTPDPPTLDLDANDSSGATGNNYQFTFTEGDGPTAIADDDTDLVDVDSTAFASVTFAVNGLVDGNAELLLLDGDTFALATAVAGQNTSGGKYHVVITTSAGSATLIVTKQGGGTFDEADTEALITAVEYQHADTNAPTSGNRLIDVTVNDGGLDSVAARSTIMVTPLNDPPIAVPDGFVVAEGSTMLLNLAGNDTDPDDGLDLTSLTIIAGPTNGTIDSINNDGTVTYTHDGSETLTDSFTYSIKDLAGATSNTTTVNVTITPTNDPPIAQPDNFIVLEGSTSTLNLASNDMDIDTGLDLTTITIVSSPTNGTIDSINTDGTVTYTHDGSETLTGSFTYTIQDLAGTVSNSATVNLTITPQNDAPIITSDGGGGNATVSVIEGNTTATDVNAFDAEGTPLAYSIIGGADAGLFGIDASTGLLTFNTAPELQTPSDSNGDNIYDIVVQASDGTLVDTQSIAITVVPSPIIVLPPPPEPPPDPPPPDDGNPDNENHGGNINLKTPSPIFVSRNSLTNSEGQTRDAHEAQSSRNNDLALLQVSPRRTGVTETLTELFKTIRQPLDLGAVKSEIQSLLGRSSGLLRGLDRVRDTLNDVSTAEKSYVVSSIAVSTGLSVGYVIWLLRSGVLLTALLSSVPAWQFVNPLLVLDSPAKKKREQDTDGSKEDSLETMFDQREKEPVAQESPSKTTRRSRWTRQP